MTSHPPTLGGEAIEGILLLSLSPLPAVFLPVFFARACSSDPPGGEGLEALECSHGHVGDDGRPQGEGGDGHGDGVGHGEGLEALEGPHGHVGGDGSPKGEDGD